MRPVEGYEDRYAVDSDGTVYSRLSGKWLARKSVLHGTGYTVVRLCASDGKIKTHRVHRLVAKAWLEPPEQGKDNVNHIDGNKQNNNSRNLEWCSNAENTEHAIRTGLLKLKGFDNPSAKLTEEDAKKAYNMVLAGKQIQLIAKELGVNRNAIRSLLNRVYGKEWQVAQKEQYRSI